MSSQGNAIFLTFLVIHNLAFIVFEHLRMGDTCVSDIADHVEICPTLVGNDLEEGGASRTRSTEDENHLPRSQNARVPGRMIRMQIRAMIPEGRTYE
jgi:hypothetical protein